MKYKRYLVKKMIKRYRAILIAILILVFFEDALFGFNSLQNRYPILGLKFNHRPLLLKDRTQVEDLVRHQFDLGRPLRLVYGNQNFSITPSEVRAQISPALSTNQLLQVGRTGSFFNKLITQNRALLGMENQSLSGNISSAYLALKLFDLQDRINQDPKPIMPNFMDDYNKTIPAQDGIRIDTNRLSQLIYANIFNPLQRPISIPTTTVKASYHTEAELAPIRKQVPDLVKQPISISSGGLIFTLDTEDILSLLTVQERLNPQNPKTTKLVIRLDDKKLNQKLGEFALKVENKTQAEFDEYDARIAIYSQFLSTNRSLSYIPTGSRLNVLGVLNNKGPKIAYLTFDDGTNVLYHPLILEILKQENVKATFFLIGSNVQKSPSIAQRTVAEGHVIGDHTLTHPFLPSLSAKAIVTELQSAKDILTPYQPITLFRPPYGGTNTLINKEANQLRLKQYLWNVDPQDWTEPAIDELVKRVVSKTYSGAIILMHSNHASTVRALPKIIDELKNEGYIFSTLN